MKAVILAGGKGRRLRPYTTVVPKPLMPIGERPILEIVLKQLKAHGFDEAVIAVGHLPELIKAFFGDGAKFGFNITYSREDEPLGTAGCLGLLKDRLDDTFLMMNGDILTSLEYSDLIRFHRQHGALATIALKRRDVHIDFGVVEVNEKDDILGYREKPTLEHLVSMGVYVFEPRILDYVEQGRYLDFPDLMTQIIRNGENVKAYIFDGYWLDIGRFDDYERANREIDQIFPSLTTGDV